MPGSSKTQDTDGNEPSQHMSMSKQSHKTSKDKNTVQVQFPKVTTSGRVVKMPEKLKDYFL